MLCNFYYKTVKLKSFFNVNNFIPFDNSFFNVINYVITHTYLIF